MKHNQHNPDFVFVQEPVSFNKFTERAILQYCLGGTLYMPGTKPIADRIVQRALPEMTSMVMCLEDAVAEACLAEAEANVFSQLDLVAAAIRRGALAYDDVPLIFVRVKNADQFRAFARRLTQLQAEMLTGFVFPKFDSANAAAYFDMLNEVSAATHTQLYAMPILEGRTIAYMESRTEELSRIKRVVDAHRDQVLNIRVGGTDFSAIFGVRRDINTSIYNIIVVCDCLTTILNQFNRVEDDYVVSAPVWEYFLAYKQEDLNELLSEKSHQALFRRSRIVNEAVDGLIREVAMDKANGFVGKTVIHPSHLRFVNGMQAVSHEEFDDAAQILGAAGGVTKSAKANKMNEVNPHRSWARRVVARAAAYGVIEDDYASLELILGRT
jgi:citrate lyase beta subunit